MSNLAGPTLFAHVKEDIKWTLYFEKSDYSTEDLTGQTVYFTVKSDKTDADSAALIAKTITTHAEPTSGKTEIVLTATDTNKTPGMYYYGIERMDASGKISVVAEGLFSLSRKTRIG